MRGSPNAPLRGTFPPGGRQRGKEFFMDKMTTIMLPRGRKNEENFVIVSVNGRSFQIMKGVEVQVPDYVAEVLSNNRRMAEEAQRYVDRMAE